MKKIAVLFVCLGNICRSPAAEAIFINLIEKKKLTDGFIVDSAGTGSWHIGSAPDKRSIEVADKHGIDIRHQKARQFTNHDFNKFDHIYVMDKSNFSDVVRLASTQNDVDKVKLILQHVNSENPPSVPDPYYGGNDGFENVYQLLDAACQKIIDKIKQNL